ncbi:MAG TPA: sulfite reductase subunit alpha [Burkholderiaceae bacterium]|nr:sulfite reductase subunit alpha [Burkholderiaceae bacterium]
MRHDVDDEATAAPELLIAFGSQTGTAIQLAWAGARALKAVGQRVRVLPLNKLCPHDLQGARYMLFVVSTYGDGEAPDNAANFERRTMSDPASRLDLRHLQYGVLALGDRTYADFCAFGARLDAWLEGQGARRWFDLIEADKGDDGAVTRWREQLARVVGVDHLPAWRSPGFERWRLLERRLLNPGSLGEPTYHLALEPVYRVPGGPMPHWEAGDLAQIVVPDDPSQPRDYSIATLPADGSLQLLVRQEHRSDGRPGLASGWLTQGLAHDGEVDLRLRPNPTFRLGGNVSRPLILVGNGTGLAGVRALLKARIAAGQRCNWLMFGERSEAHDFYHRDELQAWFHQGWLKRLDLAFSRDQGHRVYVQHRLVENERALMCWVDDGAAIYVCGSLHGMAGEVDAALRRVMGTERVDVLADEGRYRRDVY